MSSPQGTMMTKDQLFDAETLDGLRLDASSRLDPENRGKLGQFMTPARIADFMAGLFKPSSAPVSLLDCGAGIGSLTIAAVKHLKDVSAAELWEIDSLLLSYLGSNLEGLGVPFRVHSGDFIQDAVVNLATGGGTRFTHAILNPPYKKIASDSKHRLLLRKVDVETVNLYTAFLALTILLMKGGGQIVAIIPRSFCNGPYYRPFRMLTLRQCSIEHIHVFTSRRKAFRDDAVLQENVIIKLVKGRQHVNTIVSVSEDQTFGDYSERTVPFSEIVKADDSEAFIHIPTTDTLDPTSSLFVQSLDRLGLEVCTGPVVDFRLKAFWLQHPTVDSVPLLYPHHFSQGTFVYPIAHKKPNALLLDDAIRKWLMPNGHYVIVKRFSAKEERRRVVAYVVNPDDIASPLLGFENHWNVFHVEKGGLDRILAQGLASFLNSSTFDQYFRVFSGHTQVNATDLRNMRYPSIDALRQIGRAYRPGLTQTEIDELVGSVQ